MKTNSKKSVQLLAMGAMLTALVIVLQLMGSFIRFGIFSVSLVLVPIVIGAATCGVGMGSWLGLVFGIVVLASGDAAAFLAVNVPGTIITVLAKGALCGLCAGLVYKLLQKHNRTLGTVAAAVVCPIVNTGVFLIGCRLFFYETVAAWGAGLGFENAAAYMFLGLAGANFLFELAVNLILSPTVVYLIRIAKKSI